MGRSAGYYWVRLSVGWQVASWSAPNWFLVGFDVPRNQAILEIDERRLVRPDEVK